MSHKRWRWQFSTMTSLRMLMVVLALSIAGMTAILFSVSEIKQLLNQKAAVFLGGDLTLASPTPIAAPVWDLAKQQGLTQARVIEFSTMLHHGDQWVLSELKAVGGHYPLLGDIQVIKKVGAQAVAENSGPRPGEIWLEARLLTNLGLTLGQTLEVGDKKLLVMGILATEPDKISGGFFFPRAMVRLDDIEGSDLLSAGSRVTYRGLFSGSDDAIRGFESLVKPYLDPKQALQNARKHQNVAQVVLDRSQNYLYLVGFFNLVLAGIGLFYALKHYVNEQVMTVASLRCLGVSKTSLFRWYGASLWRVSGLAAVGGLLLGYGLAQGMVYGLARVLFNSGAEALSLPWGLVVFSVGGVLLAVGALMALTLRVLGKVPPIALFHPEQLPSDRFFIQYAVGGSVVLLLLLAWGLSEDTRFLLTLSLILMAILVIGYGLFYGLIWILGQSRAIWGVKLRYVLASFRYQIHSASFQLLTFTLLVFIGTALYGFKKQFVEDMYQNLPPNTPNGFLINIPENAVSRVESYLKQQAITYSPFYPVVRGRLFQKNGQNLLDEQFVSEKRGLNRLWNLTFLDQLPERNDIVAGRWFSSSGDSGNTGNKEKLSEVSIEAGIADAIGIKLGDILAFQIDQDKINATVTSFRRVRWDTFQPNFFAIFPGHIGQGRDKSYMTSLYVSGQEEQALHGLYQILPNVDWVDVKALLGQIRALYENLIWIVQLLFGFAIGFGALIFIVITQMSAETQQQSQQWLYWAGVKWSQIRMLSVLSWGLLGLVTSVLGVSLATCLSAWLSKTVFQMPYRWLPEYGLIPLFTVLLCIGLTSWHRHKNKTSLVGQT